MWWFGRRATPGAGEERSNGDNGGGGKDADVGKWIPYLVVGPALGVVGIVVQAWHLDSGSVFAIALLVAGAAFLVGGLLGFLFGIPRLLATSVAAPPPADGQETASAGGQLSPYAPNTNLEQISDWLTKILVGVGLVELGKLASGTNHLVDFLAPSLGGDPSGASFALALLVLYGISGFLIVYLVTRVYLGRAFAQADQLVRRIDRVEAAQRQQKRDVDALTLATRYLDSDAASAAIPQETLNESVAGASEIVRAQIFNLARQARLKGSAPQKARAPGLFNALIASDQAGSWHRNHGQLGYALFDARDYVGAQEALTTAIERRDRAGQKGFELYDYMRALSRIALDPNEGTKDVSDHATAEGILDDLRRAYEVGRTRTKIKGDKRVQSWLRRNGLDEGDLAS